VLVVGCGNLLRGDDGVGPVLIRHLWERGIPTGAEIADGGTAGMDVAFRMRGAGRVVLVDAASTGARPGTVYRVPGPELADLPPLEGVHTHAFRWDHALAFAEWLLKEDYPDDVTVFLIEAENVDPGMELTPTVRTAMEEVMDLIEADFLAPLRPPVPPPGDAVEFTGDGYLRMDADLAARKFPADSAVAVRRDGELWLVPLRGPENGGLLLKQRTAAGDRCLLIREVLDDRVPVGRRPAVWDAAKGALRITLEPEPGT
jgi:hydrogenase maturation protease